MLPGADSPHDEAIHWDELPAPLEMPTAELLRDYHDINVLAPLVRCSKLPFRHLVSLYETHITHTPMILAQEFSRNQKARVSDFTSSSTERGVFWVEPKESGKTANNVRRDSAADRPEGSEHAGPSSPSAGPSSVSREGYVGQAQRGTDLPLRLPPSFKPPTKHSQLVRGRLVAQFASPNAASLADAAELISPYVDSIDINCGCPQKWAYQEGIGCALLRKPELVRDMIRTVKDRLGWDYGISVKIRVDPDLKLTEKLVRTAVEAGASHVTIHGRTRHQASTEPVNLEALRFAVECATGEVPCVGNGDIWDHADAVRMREFTDCTGIMGARGLLAKYVKTHTQPRPFFHARPIDGVKADLDSPAMFAGYSRTPEHAVAQFVSLTVDYGLLFPLFHHHMSYMLETHFQRAERIYFNTMPSQIAVMDYLSGRGFGLAAVRGDPMWDARRGRQIVQYIAGEPANY